MDLKTAERIARGENLRPEAEKVIAKHEADKKAARARRRSRSPRASGDTRADRKAAKREETARLRAFADARDPVCVICQEPAPEPWELHHVDSGSGKTERQTGRNTCKTHEGCHKRAHRGDTDALWRLYHWAVFNGYEETREIVARRIGKIEEARAFAKRLRCRYGATVCTHAQCQRTP